jgi:hypothetical protein
MLLITLFLFILHANAINNVISFSGIGRTLTESSIPTEQVTNTITSTVSSTSSSFVPFSGTGHQLGGERTHSESRLLEVGVQRIAQEVIQRSNTVSSSIVQNVFQETVGVCTRSSSCASTTLQNFPSIGLSGTNNQAAQQVLQNIAIQETNSVIGRVLDNAGPIIATSIAGYEIIGNLIEGDYTAAATTATRSLATYQASIAAATACASWTAPSAIINPAIPAISSVLCAITSSAITGRIVDTTASFVTSGTITNTIVEPPIDTSNNSDNSSLNPIVETTTVTSSDIENVVTNSNQLIINNTEIFFDNTPLINFGTITNNIIDRWEPTNEQLSSSSYLSSLRQAEIFLITNTDENIRITTRTLLDHIINENLREENTLQPSENSQLLLRHFVNSGTILNPRTMTNRQWLNLLGNGNILFRSFQHSTINDQENRARSIAESLINSGETTVTLMDGHGRIVYLILYNLREMGQDVNNYRFRIFDIDDNVNAWHERFLPQSVTIHPHDIFAYNYLLEGIVYFNFCGIRMFARSTILAIQRLVGQGRIVYLSFSRRGIDPDDNTFLSKFYRFIIRCSNHPVRGINSEFISQHGLFPTYRFFNSN